MKKAKILALVLALVMTASLFAGCSGNSTAETTAGQTTAVETTAPQTEATTQKPDLQNYEFVLATAFADKFIPVAGSSEMGDRQLAAYESIQQEYNFKLSIVAYAGDMEAAITAAIAGEKIGDFIMLRHSDFFPLSAAGYLRPLDGDELKGAGLDITDDTKWSQEGTMISKFGDNVWALSTNGEFYPFVFGYQIAFNDRYTQEAGYSKEDIYNLVKAGNWTWDVFLDICQKETKDVDGDGVLDQYGNTSWVFGCEMLTNGVNPIFQDNTGKWVCDFSKPAVVAGLEFLQKCQQANVTKSDVEGNGDLRVQFTDGKAAFVTVYYWHLLEDAFKNSPIVYGLVPQPKGPDATGYVQVVPDLDAWVMLTSNTDYEKSVIAMNAWGDIMTDDGWKDTVKQVFTDETSWEIFNEHVLPNTILNNLKVTSEIWSKFRSLIATPIRNGEALPSTIGEQQNPAIQALLDSAFNTK